MNKTKLLFIKLLIFCSSLFFILLSIEVMLKFFPVSTGGHTMPLNEKHTLVCYKKNTTMISSSGWRMKNKRTYHVNNYGFLNLEDYSNKITQPILAIIGDSYVEAQQVSQKKTLYSILQKKASQKFYVYSLARSFAPLSQYVKWAEFAHKEFNPQKMIFCIVGNDFDDSLAKYNKGPGYRYFIDQSEKQLHIKRFDYEPGALKRVLRYSSLARYAIFNLKIRDVFYRLGKPGQLEDQMNFAGSTHFWKNDQIINDSKKVVDTFLFDVLKVTNLLPQDILFVVDGIRPQMYNKAYRMKAKESYFATMRSYFMNEANNLNFEVIDMDIVFFEHYKKNNVKFEFPDDAHWNETGHRVVAEAILKSKVYSSF